MNYANLVQTTDAVHLRRRDYNLMPQVYPDGTLGYMISAGVFQAVTDMPFLYPVDINSSGYIPQTSFNQYLSHYHSATTSMYDATNNRMHNIFFGGLSQYYYDNGSLVQDDNVPFVKTISLVTREADSTLTEYQLPLEMPGLKGASAEFIPNLALDHYENEVLKLNTISGDSTLLGWIFGGIESSSLNPFANNTIADTQADNTIYEVWIKAAPLAVDQIDGKNPYRFEVLPNPVDQEYTLRISNPSAKRMDYYIAGLDGKIVEKDHLLDVNQGTIDYTMTRSSSISQGIYLMTLVFDGKYFVTKKVVFE